jgi:F-type H+-transporting ATPase subunit a
VLAVLILGRILAPVPLPVIQLPAEPIHFGPFTLPNTFIATLLADVVLLALAFAATRRMSLVPSGIQNVMEWIIEGFLNLAEDITGHNARKFFPWAMTIFLIVLVANWMHFIPGFDSVGWLESHVAVGTEDNVLTHYKVEQLGPIRTIVNEPYTPTYEEYHHAHEEHVLPTNEAGEEVAVVVPFLRAASTDLNFTLALALSTVLLVQIYGIQALGLGYFSKFFNFKGGAIGFFVGIFELISELSRIISFAFRLFGNIFGGMVLLFVLAFLVPWLLPVPFYGLEIFIGAIQAFVFALLALVFFAGSVVSHDEHSH